MLFLPHIFILWFTSLYATLLKRFFICDKWFNFYFLTASFKAEIYFSQNWRNVTFSTICCGILPFTWHKFALKCTVKYLILYTVSTLLTFKMNFCSQCKSHSPQLQILLFENICRKFQSVLTEHVYTTSLRSRYFQMSIFRWL